MFTFFKTLLICLSALASKITINKILNAFTSYLYVKITLKI